MIGTHSASAAQQLQVSSALKIGQKNRPVYKITQIIIFLWNIWTCHNFWPQIWRNVRWTQILAFFFFSFTFIPHHGLQRRRHVFSRRVSSPRLVFISYLFYLYKTGEAKYVVVHKKSCLVNKKIQCQIRYDKVTWKLFYYDTELHDSECGQKNVGVEGKMRVWSENVSVEGGCECVQKPFGVYCVRVWVCSSECAVLGVTVPYLGNAQVRSRPHWLQWQPFLQ